MTASGEASGDDLASDLMAEHRPLTVDTTVADDLATLTVVGDLDLDTGPLLADALAAPEVEAASRVEIDATDLRYCDSSGIRVLVVARETASERGVTLVLRNVNGAVAKVLEITGLLETFT